MKTSKTFNSALSTVICVIILSACQRENLSIGTSAGKIKALVSTADASTKSAESSRGTLNTTIQINEKIVLQEYVSDNFSQPFGEMGTQTKGTIVTTDEIAKVYGLFGMESFLDNYDDINCDDHNRPVLTDDDHYISSGQVKYEDNDWNLTDGSNPYSWLHNIHFTFWSYAPLAHSGIYSYSAKGSRSTMKITDYISPAKAEEQKDLLVAYNNRWFNDQNKKDFIDIEFRHALAVINFVNEIDDYTVTKVSISGAAGKGTCTINGEDLDDIDVTTAFYWEPDEEVTDTFVMSGTEDNFFMIPQDLSGKEVKIRITLEKSGIPSEHEATLSTKWLAGKYYTYTLQYDNHFVVDVNVDERTDNEGGAFGF